MKTLIKSPDQIEFADLVKKLVDANWTQAQIGKALGYESRAAVSMVLSGKSKVPHPRLEKLRELAKLPDQARAHVEQIEQKESPVEQLQYLRENDPAGFEVAKITIETLHRRAVGGVSSSVASAAVNSQAAALAAAQSELQSYKPKRATVAPSVHKPEPKLGVAPAKEGAPEIPKLAPKRRKV